MVWDWTRQHPVTPCHCHPPHPRARRWEAGAATDNERTESFAFSLTTLQEWGVGKAAAAPLKATGHVGS